MEDASMRRPAVPRASVGSEVQPPEWWSPWSDAPNVMEQAKRTVLKRKDAKFMTWLDERGRESQTFTFEGLWSAAEAVATKMVEEWGVETGDRVLLCYLPGMAFMVAYWACLRLRVIAVPVYPPDPSKLEIGLKKLDLVRESCKARLCLTETTLDQMRVALSLTHSWPRGLKWKRTDDIKVKRHKKIDVDVDTNAVAFLQYTSGSTGDPKGVMLTFENVWHNVNEVYLPAQLQHLKSRGVDITKEIVGVSWLPQFHDTGLILCIAAPFVAGYRMINFSPLTFLRSPLLWMRALSQYQAQWSAAPDFAYELCVRRLMEEPTSTFDLRQLRQLACGAGERCRPQQLSSFLSTFAQFHLRPDVFVPNYGLAEHVVGTCGCADGVVLSRKRPDLACCGEHFQIDLRIVDPVSFEEAERGEIWISSRSVAAGYWGKPELSEETFEARMVVDGKPTEHRYLRTGDEGFLEDGRLYICGRLKDLIIVGGKNYFPEDVEIVAQAAAEEIRPGCVAAFASVENSTSEETVTCVFELRTKPTAGMTDEQLGDLCERVRRKVGIVTGLLPSRVVAIPERSIPKTTSGKVQRRNTRKELDSKRLLALYDSAGLLSIKPREVSLWGWGKALAVATENAASVLASLVSYAEVVKEQEQEPTPPPPTPPPLPKNPVVVVSASSSMTADELRVETTAVLLNAIGAVVEGGRVTPTTAFYELGLSSRQMIQVLRTIETDLHIELPPTVVFSCPSVSALAAEIVRLKLGEEEAVLLVQQPQERPKTEEVQLCIRRVACRLPGESEDSASLSRLVRSSACAVGVVPLARWDHAALSEQMSAEGVGSATLKAASYGAFTRGAADFEPRKFLMRPAEAAAMDPQQRLLVTKGAELLNVLDNRESREAHRGSKVGVVLGMMSIDAVLDVPLSRVGPNELTGNGYAAAGSRLSFLLDLHGPASTVDTACSAALVAANQAASYIRAGEATSVVFGGLSLMLCPSFVHLGVAAARMASQTGRCHTFDCRADGYVRAEGCALALLEVDCEGHQWVSSSVQHNGQSATFTALNAASQRRLLEAVLGGRECDGVEAHGTGTGLGDPIEVGALQSFFASSQGSSKSSVSIAGLKASIGHTEPTAGAAGLLAALSAPREAARPNAALRRLNPVVCKFKNLVLPVDVAPTMLAEKIKGVSSFGYSGIIAHAAILTTDEQEVVKKPCQLRARDRNEVVFARRLERWRGAAHPLLQRRKEAGWESVVNATPGRVLSMAVAAVAKQKELNVVVLKDVKLRCLPGKVTLRCVVEDSAVTVESDGILLLEATISSGGAKWKKHSSFVELEPWELSPKVSRAWASGDDGMVAHAVGTTRAGLIDGAFRRTGRLRSVKRLVATEAHFSDHLKPSNNSWWIELHGKDCRLSDRSGSMVLTGCEHEPGQEPVWYETAWLPIRSRPSNTKVTLLMEGRGKGEKSSSLSGVVVLLKMPSPRDLEALLCKVDRLIVASLTFEEVPQQQQFGPRRLCRAYATNAADLKLAVQACLEHEVVRCVNGVCTAPCLRRAPPPTRRRMNTKKIMARASSALIVRCAGHMSSGDLELLLERPEVSPSLAAALLSVRGRAKLTLTSKAEEHAFRQQPSLAIDIALREGSTGRSVFLSPQHGSYNARRLDIVASRLPAASLEAAVCAFALASSPSMTLVAPLLLDTRKHEVVRVRRTTVAKKKKIDVRTAVVGAAKQVLGTEEVDLEASLTSLGVDSLQGVELLQLISTAVGRDLPATLLLQAESLQGIVESLQGGEEEEHEEVIAEKKMWLEPVGPLGLKLRTAPSSPDQEILLWMVGDKRCFAWLPVTVVGEMRGPLDKPALHRAVDLVVGRHEALRSRLLRLSDSSLVLVDGERPKLLVEERDDRDSALERVQQFHDASTNDPYENNNFRALLINFGNDAHVLYLATNHALSDGWSQQLLYNELVNAYNDGALEKQDSRSYTEFLTWQSEMVRRGAYNTPECVAQRELYAAAKRLPVWPSLTTKSVFETLRATGALLKSEAVRCIDAGLAAKLQTRLSDAAYSRASLPSAVLAAYVYALGWLARGETSAVMYSHSGRAGHPEFHHTYGQLATDMNVIMPGDAPQTLGSFVATVHASVLGSLNLAGVPYAIAYDRGGRGALPPQFNWYDRYSSVDAWNDLQVTELGVDMSAMKARTFNIGAIYLMGLAQADGSIVLKFFFNEHVYAPATIDGALQRIEDFLAAIATSSEGNNPPLPPLAELS